MGKSKKAFLVKYEVLNRAKLPQVHAFHEAGCDNGAGGKAFQSQIALAMRDYDTDFRVSDGEYYGYTREVKCGGGKWLNGEELVAAEDFITEFCSRNDFLVWAPEYDPDEVTAFCFRVTRDFIEYLIEEKIVTKTVTKRDGNLWRVHHGGDTSPMWRAVSEREWMTLEEMMAYCREHRKH